MILYTLRCDKDHRFEAWFREGATFEAQAERRQVLCPTCGSQEVEKAIMAPRLGKAAAEEETPTQKTVQLDPKAAELRQTLVKLRRHVEENCDNVGPRFAEEARKIHYGEVDPRGIYGETTDDEAKDLKEEGVDVARIPWISTSDA
jgi:hypothetical protein